MNQQLMHVSDAVEIHYHGALQVKEAARQTTKLHVLNVIRVTSHDVRHQN